MADDKGEKPTEKQEDCLSAATFDIKVCKHEEKKPTDKEPPKPKPNPLIKFGIPITATLGLTWQMTLSGSTPVGTKPVPTAKSSVSVSISKSTAASNAKGSLEVRSAVNNIPREALQQYKDSIKDYLLDGDASNAAGGPTIWSDELLDQLSQQSDLFKFLNELSKAIATDNTSLIEEKRSDQLIFNVSGDGEWSSDITLVQAEGVYGTNAPQDDKDQQKLMIKKALEVGCMPYPSLRFASSQWLCPLATISASTPDITFPKLGFIQGANVNIRESPTLDGAILGTASYEFVGIAQENDLQDRGVDSPTIRYKNQTNAPELSWYPIIWNSEIAYVAQPYLTLLSNQSILLVKETDQWSLAIITTE